jgi:hypothetical protein
MKYVPPSTTQTAFNCPHCSVLTTQFWHKVYTDPMKKDETPWLLDEASAKAATLDGIDEKEEREKFQRLFERLGTGEAFIHRLDGSGERKFWNVHVSTCYECKKPSIWLYKSLLYPTTGDVPPANPDLPDDIRRDYDEACSILNASPRGAAALLRLAIQKLCIHLGQPGKSINDDIGALVAQGLSVTVQRALDSVRVIGNNAVHPGKIDMTDNRDAAETLFHLVNLISEKMISEQKHVDDFYSGLPEGIRLEIERRNQSALEGE